MQFNKIKNIKRLKELNEGTIIEERKDENKQQIRKQVCMVMMLTKNFYNY